MKTKTETKTYLKTKTKTLFFVLEAPRDQDCGLEDYITAWYKFLQSLMPFLSLNSVKAEKGKWIKLYGYH